MTLFPPPRLAVLADALALATFALVGMLSHDGVAARGFAEDALPLAAGWFAAGAALGLYRRPSRRTLVLTWLVGIPLGVAVRAVALGRATDPRELAFLATTLVFTLAFVCALRAALANVQRSQHHISRTMRRASSERRFN